MVSTTTVFEAKCTLYVSPYTTKSCHRFQFRVLALSTLIESRGLDLQVLAGERLLYCSSSRDKLLLLTNIRQYRSYFCIVSREYLLPNQMVSRRATTGVCRLLMEPSIYTPPLVSTPGSRLLPAGLVLEITEPVFAIHHSRPVSGLAGLGSWKVARLLRRRSSDARVGQAGSRPGAYADAEG